MKSSHSSNNDESEPDVELFPTRSSSSGTRTSVAVASDVTTTRNDCDNDALSLVFADECISYRSKCNIDEIPIEARGWTWSDPYYDMNDPSHHDIIAAFDIDRNLYDQSTFDMFKWFFLLLGILTVVMTCLLATTIASEENFFIFPIFVFSFGVGLSAIYFIVLYQRFEKKLRIQCMHIAIGTRGIYIDEVDSLGSKNLMNRTRITYDKIKKCQAESEYNPFHKKMNHRIAINTKEDFAIKSETGDVIVGYFPKYTIEGIKMQQKFVDIVNAMLDRHSVNHCLAAATTADVESEIIYDGTSTNELL